MKYDPNTDPDPIHAVDIYINAAGETVRLYVRTCPASGREYSWVHELTALDAAKAAHDEVTRKLPRLQPQLAPPTSFGGVVNINTWIGLDPPAPVSVTASVPGFSSTVTATASRVAWSPGDGSTVECGNLGVVWHPGITTSLHDAPCGWTPKYPSLAKYTGTDDKTYHGEFRVIWTITWSGSDGRSGTFAEITVTTPTTYKVSEIQTIGAG